MNCKEQMQLLITKTTIDIVIVFSLVAIVLAILLGGSVGIL